MSFQALNLGLRFCLELTSLVAIGMYGWRMSDGWPRYILAIVLPLIGATIWGVFNVPGDPSRSGNAPVVVPGLVRLIIELLFFAAGGYALISSGYKVMGWILIGLVIAHYFASLERISWLLKQ